MIGRIIKAEEAKGVWWSVETQLYDNGKVGANYRFETRFTMEEMDRIVELLGVDSPQQIVDADLYIEDLGLQLPGISVLVDLDGKYWSEEGNLGDIIGEISEVSVAGGEISLAIRDYNFDDMVVRGMCNSENINRIERLIGENDHSALVGERAIYCAKTHKAYIAIEIK